MKLIIGLGNPGTKYHLTRHNLGFLVVDELAEIHGINLSKKKFNALTGEGILWGESAVLAKPQTFMNLSGTAVRGLFGFYKLAVRDLLVVHDDLDLEPGAVRIKAGGGAGGHKGLGSIIESLGEADFVRIRLGIGKPPMKEQTEGYVLQRFAPDELEQTAQAVHRACDVVEALIASGLQTAMNRFNSRNGRNGTEDMDGARDD